MHVWPNVVFAYLTRQFLARAPLATCREMKEEMLAEPKRADVLACEVETDGTIGIEPA